MSKTRKFGFSKKLLMFSLKEGGIFFGCARRAPLISTYNVESTAAAAPPPPPTTTISRFYLIPESESESLAGGDT